MTAAAEAGSGRPQLSIVSKDTTLRFSIGALVAVVGAVAGGSFWVSNELGKLDKRLDTNQNDLKVVLETFRGYSRRADDIFGRVHEFDVIKDRLQRNEHSGEAQDRRMASHESQIGDILREVARNSAAIDLLMRSGGDPSRKRNFAPYRREEFFNRGTPARADRN